MHPAAMIPCANPYNRLAVLGAKPRCCVISTGTPIKTREVKKRLIEAKINDSFHKIGCSLNMKPKLSFKSLKPVMIIFPSACLFSNGIWIKISITAATKKQPILTYRIGANPTRENNIPPITGPTIPASELIKSTMELASIRQNRVISSAVLKSRITMMFLLFTRSAMIPPMGNRISIGIKELARIVPNKTDEPV